MSLSQPVNQRAPAADPRLAPLFEDLGRAQLLAERVLGDRALAEDAVQEACMRYIRRPPREPGEPAALRAYFLRAVHGAAVDLARNEAARRNRQESRGNAPENVASPETAAAQREAALAARREMSGLPPDLRTAICLCCEEGLTQAEAAEILEVPRKTVADRVGRGLEKLRERLAAAGYAALPAAALAPALGSLGVPSASAALAAKVGALAQSAKLGAAIATGAASAAKGGLAVKIVVGVVLAGALAGGATILNSVGAQHAAPLQSPPSAGGEVYSGEMIIGQLTQGGSFGAGRICQGWWPMDQVFSAKRGRLYGFEGTLTSYDPETGLKEAVAGVGTGDLDGPREVWRGSSWSYQQAGIGLDDAKGILYLLASNKVKALSLDDGSLRTLSDVRVSSLCMDAEGMLYGAGYAGLFRIDPATGKTTKLSTEPFPGKDHSPWGYMAVDLKRGKAYGHCRGDVHEMDLKTGKFSLLCGGGKSFAAGPFKEAGWYCPSGAQLTADNRYLIVGGGDQQTFTRLDLEGQRREMLVRSGKGAETRWTWGDTGNKQDPGIFPWPSTVAVDPKTGDLYFGIPVYPGVARLKRAK